MPFGEPDIKKAGKDLTILTIGATLYRALEAAKTLEERVRHLVRNHRRPLDRAVQLRQGDREREEDAQDPAGLRCLRARQLPAHHGRQDHQFAFDELDAPPVVVGAATGSPRPREEDAFFPRRPTSSTRSTSTPAAEGLQDTSRMLNRGPDSPQPRRGVTVAYGGMTNGQASNDQ